MRVSTDPNDKAYTEARPRVWLGEREILGWITADEFRRVVITADGPMFGAVRVERLLEAGVPSTEPVECTSSLSGICEKVAEPESAPDFTQPKVAVKPAAMSAKKRGKK